VHCANSDLLLYIFMKKSRPPIFLQIQRWSSFSPKTGAQIVQKALPHSPIEPHTTKTKPLPIRPTMATLVLAQHNNQPTISWHESKYEDNSYSLCNFILVDCCIVASFLDLVKSTPPWPCWLWQLRFRDGITSNPTDTCRINQVEYKLNSIATRFFLSIFFSLKFIGKTPWSRLTTIDRR
jgi:hypothetical protein